MFLYRSNYYDKDKESQEETEVVDLLKQPEFIQLSGPSSFFKAEAIGDIKFNVKLHFVCKGSFKPDVCNIHSKEQSLFLA